MDAWRWLMLADSVLALHLAFVAFVVLGLALVLAGGMWHWRWVRNPWFRTIHLLAIVCVAGQTWLNIECPLTTLEMALRARAGTGVYTGSFIGYWLQAILYFRAPNWVFAVCYSVFALAVVLAWLRVRPRRFAARSARR